METCIEIIRMRDWVLLVIGIFLCSIVMCVSMPVASEPEDGLIGYWSFDKIEDGIVEDISGNGNHGLKEVIYAWAQ